MKALVYTGPESLDYRDEPDLLPAKGEVLVRIGSAGICGSDMHAYLGHDERRPAPLILGHEASGIVVSGPDAGRRVTINPLVTCGSCAYCSDGRQNLCASRQIISMPPRPGAFAQFVSIPEENLVTVPEDFDLEKAALAEPLACGWHAVRLGLSALHCNAAEARCVVIGGGAIGIASALSLAARGADSISIIETNRLRYPALERAGAHLVIDPAGPDAPGDATVDMVIDAVGTSATREMACRLARPGGVIVHIGLGDAAGGLDVRRMTLQELTFIGTYTYTKEDFRDTASAMFDGRLGSLDWYETRPLGDGPAAFADIRQGRAEMPKIILKPNE